MVAARCQSAGRGQRGNSWEAAPGENLTFSIAMGCPGLPPARQWAISRAVALAIVHWLDRYLPAQRKAAIKWPNDIYVGDSKICGILIENVLTSGRIERTVIGVGININQKVFESDAPNPVSLSQITGQDYPLDRILEEVSAAIIAGVEAESEGGGVLTVESYMSRLWRRDGFHPFRDKDGEFTAEITEVGLDGRMTLRRADSSLSSYYFKEVTFII